MPCPPLVPISIIPPVSQGVAPILWQNGNQITRLNIPLNPSFLVYDGTKTRWGDGSAQAPVYLPNIQEVNGPTVTYVAGITSTGQLVKTIGASGTALVGGTAGAVVYQTGPSATGFTAVGTTGQLLSSNGVSAPTWLNQSAIAAGSATTATTATNLASGVAGSLPYQSAPSTTGFTAAGTSGQVLKSNGTSAPSWITPASTNTASAIVQRDSSGNFSAGTITASLTGTASDVANGSVTPAKLSTGGLYWDTSGNVGIGTSSPTQKLDVFGIINVNGNPITNCPTTAKAWVNFDGTGTFSPNPSTTKIHSSYNVSSITKNGTGSYQVNYSSPLSNTSYCVTGTCNDPSGIGVVTVNAYATTSCSIQTARVSPLSVLDMNFINVQVFGN